VYYINGLVLFGEKDRDLCTTDGGHPNDLGFLRMAEAVYPVLRKALHP
jgi:lysophospholipase L1-like esterase